MLADELKPAYLLAGTDRPKIDRALDRLRRRFEPDTVEFLSTAEASGDDVPGDLSIGPWSLVPR